MWSINEGTTLPDSPKRRRQSRNRLPGGLFLFIPLLVLAASACAPRISLQTPEDFSRETPRLETLARETE